jgi:hypothetical protein
MKDIPWLIDDLHRRSPGAVQLAEAVSLAVRVDPELLRMARLRLLPDVDAGAEADLWFSPLVLADNPLALVLLPEAVLLLRQSLFSGGLLDRAWEILKEAHKDAPPAIRLEEEIVYEALRKAQGFEVRINRLLLSAVRALVDERHLGLAHWSMRILPRLPDEARTTNAARMLGIAAAGQLRRPLPLTYNVPLEVRQWLPWLIQPAGKELRVGIRLLDENRVEVSQPPEPGAHWISVPDSNPIPLDFDSPRAKTGEEQIVLRPSEIRTVRQEIGNQFLIRTASGRSYSVEPTPAQSTSTVRILHLSDLQFTAGRYWKSDAMLRNLGVELEQLFQLSGRPDVIAITGDLAANARAEEYQRASEWIDECLLPVLGEAAQGRLLIVPGNHDATPGAIDEAWLKSQRDRISSGDFTADERDKTDAMVAERFRDFSTFCSRYHRGDRSRDAAGDVVFVNVGATRVAFLRTNSAWLGTNEEGSTLIGTSVLRSLERQIAAADASTSSASDARKPDLTVALFHHPLNRLADRRVVEESLAGLDCKLVLHGHTQNRSDAAESYSSNGFMGLSLGCGSLHGESSFRDLFQVVDVKCPPFDVAVHYRVWREEKWQQPVSPELWAGTDGVARWNIDGVMPAPPRDQVRPTRWILVAGQGTYGLPRRTRETASDLGAMLGRVGYGLITGGYQGVDHVTARSLDQSLAGTGRRLEDFLQHIVGQGQVPDYPGGTTIEVAKSSGAFESVRRADAVVLISGLQDVLAIGAMTLDLKKPLLALADTGGSAAKLYEEMLQKLRANDLPPNVSRDDLDRMADPAPGVVEWVFTALPRLIGETPDIRTGDGLQPNAMAHIPSPVEEEVAEGGAETGEVKKKVQSRRAAKKQAKKARSKGTKNKHRKKKK